MNILNEKSIGSSIHLDKIPAKYRNLKLIGRGTTSLVFDYDNDYVLMLTRDPMKHDWLQQSGLGTTLDVIDVYHPKKAIRDLDVYVMKVKKLYPLSKENKKKTKVLINWLQKHKMAFLKFRDSNTQYALKIMEMLEMDFTDQDSLREFFDFIINYDSSQYYYDFHMGNFLEDSDGKIVAIDPVVDKSIVDCFRLGKCD